MENYKVLEEYFAKAYKKEEYPTLAIQREVWSKTRPLEGITILDATPLCYNSIYKYMNLIYAGAKLSIGINPLSTTPTKLTELIKQANIELVSSKDEPKEFDIIMDCAAQFINFKAKKGRVELTRSGTELYRERGERVFMADGGKIKLIETCIGTGQGYFRAMDYLGYSNWNSKKLALFGCGKVGQGILKAAVERGIDVIVISDPIAIPNHIKKIAHQIVDYRNKEAVTKATLSCYAMVTAIGQHGAVGRTIDTEELINSNLLLANMGAEDEYGNSFPSSRILANKDSLNFILDEPTELKYIDATLTLHNIGAEYLINNNWAYGIIQPPAEVEEELISQSIKFGVIEERLKELYY